LTILTDDNKDQIDIDPTKNYLEELVGENKKFKTPEDLAKSVLFKEQHISQLERENMGMREDLTKRQGMEELYDKIASAINNPRDDTTDGNHTQEFTKENPQSPSLADLDRLVEQKLTQKQNAVQRERNSTEVVSTMQKEWGTNWRTRIREQAANMNLTDEYVNAMAADNPKAFYQLMGVKQSNNTYSPILPPVSGVNTQAFNTVNTGEKTKSYYDEMRKKDPAKYWSRQTQLEEDAQSQKLGERFFDS